MVVLGAALLWFILPPATSACEPYTFEDEDGFGFETGTAWSFRGRVVDQPMEEDGRRPSSAVVEIHDTISGEPGPDQFTILRDSGCDTWWFATGDQIIGAITNWNPHHGDDPPHRTAPYAGITHYSVAAWVIREDRVVSGRPYPGTRVKGLGTIPAMERELVAILIKPPNTATAPSADGSSPLFAMALAGIAGLVIAFRRLQPSARTTSSSDSATTSGR